MSKIRVLAVEDDPIHEEILRMKIATLDYKLIDVITDPHQIISVISATKPDVLLMDINLNSDISGIDLVNKINESFDIPTVFLTSFFDSETFNQAKKTLPSAYITKPYQTAELERGIELAVLSKQKNWKDLANSKVVNPPNYMFIKEGHSLKKVLLSQISFIEAYDKYCYIQTRSKRFMLKERLKNIANRLPDQLFVQVHRSYIINLEAIDDIQLFRNKLIIGKKEIGIGKTYKQALLSKINMLG